MSTAPDRLSAILSGMDRLDPHTPPPVAEAVRDGCANAGWDVTAEAVDHALTPLLTSGITVPPAKPVPRWRQWGAKVWNLLRPDRVAVVVAAAWFAKMAFGPAFLHLLATSKFSSFLLIGMGLHTAWMVLQGSWYTARTGEPMKQWSGLWVPLHMVAWAYLLLPTHPGPLGEPISWLAKLLLALFS